MSDVKKFNSFSISGNVWNLKQGCTLSFYNEDENGDEHDTLSISLSSEQVSNLIKMLSEFES